LCYIQFGKARNEKVSDLTSGGGFLTRGISSRACWFDFLLILTDLRVLRIFTRIFSLIFPCFGALVKNLRVQNMEGKKNFNCWLVGVYVFS